MVLSTTKKTASMDSITNQNQGGGSKKAGLPYQVGRNHWFGIALATHQTRATLYDFTNNGQVVFGLRHTVNPNVSISRPIGSTLHPVPYWRYQ